MGIATAAPNPNGRRIPAAEIAPAARALRFNTRTSVSRPTRNRKSTRAIVAVRLRYGKLSLGKMFFVNPGIRPITYIRR